MTGRMCKSVPKVPMDYGLECVIQSVMKPKVARAVETVRSAEKAIVNIARAKEPERSCRSAREQGMPFRSEGFGSRGIVTDAR